MQGIPSLKTTWEATAMAKCFYYTYRGNRNEEIPPIPKTPTQINVNYRGHNSFATHRPNVYRGTA